MKKNKGRKIPFPSRNRGRRNPFPIEKRDSCQQDLRVLCCVMLQVLSLKDHTEHSEARPELQRMVGGAPLLQPEQGQLAQDLQFSCLSA